MRQTTDGGEGLVELKQFEDEVVGKRFAEAAMAGIVKLDCLSKSEVEEGATFTMCMTTQQSAT